MQVIFTMATNIDPFFYFYYFFFIYSYPQRPFSVLNNPKPGMINGISLTLLIQIYLTHFIAGPGRLIHHNHHHHHARANRD